MYDEEAAIRAATEASRREYENAEPRGQPPASSHAIARLPEISVRDSDIEAERGHTSRSLTSGWFHGRL